MNKEPLRMALPVREVAHSINSLFAAWLDAAAGI